MLKLLPSRVLGLENLQLGVLAVALVGATLIVLPLLDVIPDKTTPSRKRIAWKRRLLLLVSLALGWVAMTPPLRLLLADRWPAQMLPAFATPSATIPILLAVFWLIVVLWIDRAATRRPGAPATLFGLVLTSAIVAYTLWESIGLNRALVVLAVFWLILIVIQAVGRWLAGPTSRRLATLASGLLLVAALLCTIRLGDPPGGAHQNEPTASAPAPTSAETEIHVVPPERRAESASRFGITLAGLAFLFVVLHCRLRYQKKARESGLAE